MRDPEIRKALRSTLDPSALIVDEMALFGGNNRIDLAVITDRLVGYEIKSEGDTTRRLKVQAQAYSEVFDEVTLVGAYKHVKHAEGSVPTWWGLIVASGAAGEVIFETIREPRPNPAVRFESLAHILWRDEIMATLEERERAKGVRGKSRAKIIARLAEVLTLEELRQLVCRCLRVRKLGRWKKLNKGRT